MKRYEVAGRKVLFYFDEVLPAGLGGGFPAIPHVGKGTVVWAGVASCSCVIL